MHRPSVEDLPPELAAAARGVARRLATRGTRAWLVGGAVRDLALGLVARDVDLASAARPEEVTALFGSVHEVGRAFGTSVVDWEGTNVQVTTFRTETGYADARRPDEVRYARELEEDARRRDFTCNALYLDPLTDELRDPCGGLADLEARVLRCVGEPRRRFAEDGLRLLRLARFAAGYGLALDPATRAGARESLEALRGVSAERVLAELTELSRRPGAARAWRELHELGVLGRLPAFEDPPPLRREALAEGVRLLERAGEPLPLGLALAVLLGAAQPVAAEDAPGRLASLRAPRQLVSEVAQLGQARARFGALCGAPSRAEQIRLLRLPSFPLVARWVRAAGDPRELERLAALEAFGAGLTSDELHPAPWITSADLARAGLEPGPRWGALLEETETRRLEGADGSRAEALTWLSRRLASGGREDAPQREGER